MSATKNGDVRLRRVALSDLKLAAFQPRKRASPENTRKLQKSIEEIGLIYPVAVNDKNELIDGHRRVAAAKALGWQDIPAIIVSGERDSIYAEVNATARKMSGNENLQVYLVNPAAVSPVARRHLEAAEESLGRTLLAKIAKAGSSIVLFRRARDVAAYLERAQDDSFLQKVVRWMLAHKLQRVVYSAVLARVSPRIIERAISKDRPLTHKYAIA